MTKVYFNQAHDDCYIFSLLLLSYSRQTILLTNTPNNTDSIFVFLLGIDMHVCDMCVWRTWD